jgi:TRAP-type C4-dicarboxylate transport system substrate-binding protein
MGPIGVRLATSAEEKGLMVLTVGGRGGFRQITTSRPILRPEDRGA